MTEPPRSVAALAARTIDIYDRNATRYAPERPRALFEHGWLERFAAPLLANARVLDLGCGAGERIGRWLRERAFRVKGVDAAPAMLAIARARGPTGDRREAAMRRLAIPERFDGIVAWDSFFHLTAEEQRAALPRIASHLAPGGRRMLERRPS